MESKDNAGKTEAVDWLRETSRWGSSLDKLHEWDPDWTEQYMRMVTNPRAGGILPPKTITLIDVALSAACTNLNPSATRSHIRAALDAGANRDEILMVLKMASVLSIHSCSLGAPILLEEARAAGVEPALSSKNTKTTPACDKMREIGQWNQAWDPFYQLDPCGPIRSWRPASGFMRVA